MPKVKKTRKTCCICLDTISVKKEARITSCRHRYCKQCIRKWSKVKNQCPQCKRNFNWIIDVHRKKKERVVKKKKKSYDEMVNFMIRLIRDFLYSSDFRLSITSGILRANQMALNIFDFLYRLVTDLNISDIVANSDEAFKWLYVMRRISRN